MEMQRYYSTIEGNKISFDTDKISYFAISSTKIADTAKLTRPSATTPIQQTTQEEPIQDQNPFPIGIFIAVAVAIVGIIIFIIIKTLRVKVKVIQK